MRRKWGKKKWYQYHFNKAISTSVNELTSELRNKQSVIVNKIYEFEFKIIKLNESRAWWMYFYIWIIKDAAGYEIDVLSDMIKELKYKESEISSEIKRESKIAEEIAVEQFHYIREEKRAYREKLIYERRISYLEMAKNIRSAQRYLRCILISECINQIGQINCYYCKGIVEVENVHLDHKNPVIRGGGNKRDNLVLACAPCNLSKGRKTEMEYIKTLIYDY